MGVRPAIDRARRRELILVPGDVSLFSCPRRELISRARDVSLFLVQRLERDERGAVVTSDPERHRRR